MDFVDLCCVSRQTRTHKKSKKREREKELRESTGCGFKKNLVADQHFDDQRCVSNTHNPVMRSGEGSLTSLSSPSVRRGSEPVDRLILSL